MLNYSWYHGKVDEARWLSEEEQRTWRSFLGATRAVFEALERELQRCAGMPHAYFVILVALSEAPDRTLRMSELARLTGSSASRLSHAVSRLEENGWVRRAPFETDRRGAVATLTDAGFAALSAAAAGHVETVRRHLFDRLTPAQVRHLREVSEAVLGAGDAPWPASGPPRLGE